MIKYSTVLRSNPSDPEQPKRAYATAQVSEVVPLDRFAQHISEHHSKYGKGDIYCVLIEMVSCMREQLLLGNKIQLGDLGDFFITLNSYGAKDHESFTANNIKRVKVKWAVGDKFTNLLKDATFQEVGTRKEQAELLKTKKESTSSTTPDGE